MSYIDGFLIAVPSTKKQAYVKLARIAAKVFKRHGALEVVEAWGDDVAPGKWTSFPRAVKLKPGETVVFSWIRWPSKAVRNKGMKKVMADPELQMDLSAMPFDGKRMIFGGFKVIVEA